MLRLCRLSLLLVPGCILGGCTFDRTPRVHDDAYAYGDGLDGTAGMAMDFELSGLPGEQEPPDAAVAPADVPADMDVTAADQESPPIDPSEAMRDDGAVVPAAPDPPRYVGACATDRDCQPDETCIGSQGLLASGSYCAAECQADADCAPGPAGSPAPECAMSTGGAGQCHLPCDALAANVCADTMMCRDALAFLSSGSCVFGG